MRALYETARWRARLGLQYLRAHAHRLRLSRTCFIGITGSAGKTTTKDLARHILSHTAPTSGTVRTANTPDMTADAVLDTTPDHRYCVLEIGAFKRGSLDLPLRLVRPRVGVLTVIGRDHYSAFRSLEAIAEEKGKLIRALPRKGVAVLNMDDPHVRSIGEKCQCRVIWVGEHEEATIRLLDSSSNWPDPLTIEIEHAHQRYTITTSLHGRHLTLSVLSALGVALAVDIPMENAIDALRSAKPSEARMEVIETVGGVTFVRDDWKAPHWTLDAPLEFLRDATAKRKIAVIGTLSDSALGPSKLYPRAARLALEVADLVVFAGNRSHYANKARDEVNDKNLFVFATVGDASQFLESTVRQGDLILLKGTNKQDHLARLLMVREAPVACWIDDCRLTAFCYRCPRAMGKSHETPIPDAATQPPSPRAVYNQTGNRPRTFDRSQLPSRLVRIIRNNAAYQALLWKSRLAYVHARAWMHRRRLSNTKFIGITGSAGKTTVKDLSLLILSGAHQVSGTEASLNVPIAVARTVLATEPTDEFCVVEIGAYRRGGFDRPLRLVRPKIGAVTIIGHDHYSAFKCIEAIAEEKGKLIAALPPDGTAILNVDDPHIRKMADRCRCPIIWVGRAKEATIRLVDASSVWPDPLMLTVEHEGRISGIQTQLHGTHLALPVITALGISLAAGIPLEKAIPHLSKATPTAGRMEIVTTSDGIVFLRDDRKAPAWSLEAPLTFLGEARAHRKVAVLGIISDYSGDDSETYKQAARMARRHADLTVFVGPHAHRALGARTGPDDQTLQGFRHIQEAAQYLRDTLIPGDLVLIKGSHKSSHLMRIVMDREQPIHCWRDDCQLNILCSDCDRLYRKPGHGHLDAQDSPLNMTWRDHPIREQKTSEPATPDTLIVVVGLGNAEPQYDLTPHNVGYHALDMVAEAHSGSWEVAEEGLSCHILIGGRQACLFKPAAHMNLTGPRIRKHLDITGSDAAHCIVVHDDLDIPMGRVRFKRDGGDAGHRGVRSVISALGTDAFARIRIGVRRPGDSGNAKDRVLSRFTSDEMTTLPDILDTAIQMIQQHIQDAYGK